MSRRRPLFRTSVLDRLARAGGSPGGGRWAQRRRQSLSRLHFRDKRTGVRRVVPTGPPSPARPKVRLQMLGAVVLVLFSLMVVRLWYLQVLNTKSLTNAVTAQAYRTSQLAAPRGVIVDRNGVPLVQNQAEEEITLSQADAQQHPAVIGALAALTGQSAAAIDTALANPQYTPYQQIPVARNVGVDVLTTLAQHSSAFPGVHAQAVSIRSYPYGTTAAHLLGYVTQISPAELKAYKSQGYQPGDQFGQSGIEAEYQQYLRGTPGTQLVEVDAQGNSVGVAKSTPAKPGDTVVLNVDLHLQQALDQALASEIQTLHHNGFAAPSGAAVVMDPNNGHVLAMASYPTYNPSVWAGGISQANYQALTSSQSHEPLINRAIAGLYTPGSTFKLATASAALQDGLFPTYGTYDDSNGRFTIPNCTAGLCTLHNSGYEVGGVLTMSKAISMSDDVFFYNLGYQFWINRQKYGEDAIQQYANAYSLGQGTGIDLPGEQPGFVDSPQVEQKLHQQYPTAYPYPQWYAGNNIEMAFGQGATIITPIELADAYSTFANGGTRYQPEVANAIVGPNGKVVKRFAPKVVGHVNLAPQNRQVMLTGFEGAVSSPIGTAYGTFQGFPLSQLQVAGKTGTASVHTASGASLAPNSLFVGFAPATHPKYVIASVISQAGFGASGSAYVVRNLFSYLLAHHMTLPPVNLQAAATGATGASSSPTGAAGSTGSAGSAKPSGASSAGPSGSAGSSPPPTSSGPSSPPASSGTSSSPPRSSGSSPPGSSGSSAPPGSSGSTGSSGTSPPARGGTSGGTTGTASTGTASAGTASAPAPGRSSAVATSSRRAASRTATGVPYLAALPTAVSGAGGGTDRPRPPSPPAG